MTILSLADAKVKLEEALDDYAKAQANSDTAVRTDYIVSMAAMDYNMPSSATYYFHAHSGPMHSQAGLVFMHQEEIKMLNREEANAE